MSLLSRKELEVVLSPEQASLAHVERALTLHGMERTAHGRQVVPCAGGDANSWRGALQALEAALPEYTGAKEPATVILSNQFLRYTLVPWSANLVDNAEETAFVRHCFAKVYGPGAQDWAIALSQESRGSLRLASAIDTELLDGLRELFARVGVRCKSIQPQLMAVFNEVRKRLKGHNLWLALLEPGHLCLALLTQGHWTQVRSQRVGADWHEELALILEREGYLSDAAAQTRDLFLWTTGLPEQEVFLAAPWTVHHLNPSADLGA